MSSNTNVVIFPKQKLNCPPQTLDEMMEEIEMVRSEKVEYMIDDLMSDLFNLSSLEGFHLNKDENFVHTAFFVEAFKSALYASVDMYHPIQDIAVQAISVEESKEE